MTTFGPTFTNYRKFSEIPPPQMPLVNQVVAITTHKGRPGVLERRAVYFQGAGEHW